MALLIIPVLKRWSRARGPYGYLRTWNWPITAREISQPYNKENYVGIVCINMLPTCRWFEGVTENTVSLIVNGIKALIAQHCKNNQQQQQQQQLNFHYFCVEAYIDNNIFITILATLTLIFFFWFGRLVNFSVFEESPVFLSLNTKRET